MNSKQKGARGERMWRDELRAEGFTARRGQQFAGGADSPDVVCEELAWLHQEVKFGNRIELRAALKQAKDDANGRPYIVAHKRNREEWFVTMPSSVFFALLRDGIEAGAACASD